MLEEIARNAILMLTLLALVFLFTHLPAPVKTSQVDYCIVTYHAAAKDQYGEWRTGWAHGYGPCSLLDRYEDI